MNKMIMENYLLLLKSTVEVYVHGTLESSNQDTKLMLQNSLNEILNSQSDTYNEMTKYGWYSINNVDANIIKQTLNKVIKSN